MIYRKIRNHFSYFCTFYVFVALNLDAIEPFFSLFSVRYYIFIRFIIIIIIYCYWQRCKHTLFRYNKMFYPKTIIHSQNIGVHSSKMCHVIVHQIIFLPVERYNISLLKKKEKLYDKLLLLVMFWDVHHKNDCMLRVCSV